MSFDDEISHMRKTLLGLEVFGSAFVFRNGDAVREISGRLLENLEKKKISRQRKSSSINVVGYPVLKILRDDLPGEWHKWDVMVDGDWLSIADFNSVGEGYILLSLTPASPSSLPDYL